MHGNSIDYRLYRRTSEPLSESTKYLFNTIDNGYLEGFKQALKEGADVNAFDAEGMTPLMSIANVYVVSGDKQPTLEKMSKLLIQNSNININAQSKQSVSTVQSRYDLSIQDEVSKFVTTHSIRKDTALHIACSVGAKDMVKILLTHPDVKTDVRNCEGKCPKDCIARGSEGAIKLEFKKAQNANELLGALANRDFYQANMLLNEELNPNCWRRMRHGEITTPLSSIIILCLRKITENGKEVLIKLLKHKELDLNQIKSTPAMIERKQLRKIIEEKQLKQIIEQAIKERLIDAINSKDLDDVKKLVEDNYFMNYAIIIAAWKNVNNLIEPIVNYLNEKFPASVEQSLPEDFKQAFQEVVIELERTKAQLIEKEREALTKFHS
ncbi:ankyrin repeat domain-containing protein [Wolbachia endosymbiont of Atemnus politus]|uniref:ankyrin repeat domain-containing protein n=1 Tax=Wolbachia endosymbiont of Atemnus politus TaxID=2682840 RepID=UPI0015724E56|nr:ankyrin repeat domain-containing protein [Wolbachia endosymbiont of Atemnus politus]NSX83172.1 ankyrin repeat domain-containing protein [Wolbachia endosymbiont of Atemnus politus]